MKRMVYNHTHAEENGTAHASSYRVVEARLVSPYFRRPSTAMPRFSLLLASRGVKVNSFSKVELASMVSLECEGCDS